MVLANVMLNYVLIFGKFGFPALGIAGAAIASSISEAVSVLFFILYTWKKVDYKKYGLFEYSGIDFRMLRQILGVSIWIMIQHGIAFLGWFVFFVVMEHQGERRWRLRMWCEAFLRFCLCLSMPLLRLQFAGQQSDWCWKAGTGDGIVRAYDTDLLLLRFAARYSDCPIPGTGIAHLHG